MYVFFGFGFVVLGVLMWFGIGGDPSSITDVQLKDS